MPDTTSHRRKRNTAANAAVSARRDDGSGILLSQLKSPTHDDIAAITHLWIDTGLIPAIRDASKDIESCINADNGSLIVARLPSNQRIIATMMTGHDGIFGWIHYLAIAKDVQNLGLGRQLIDLAEDILRAAKIDESRVTIENEEVAEFYAKLGYQPLSGTAHTKAHDGITHSIMRKRLNP